MATHIGPKQYNHQKYQTDMQYRIDINSDIRIHGKYRLKDNEQKIKSKPLIVAFIFYGATTLITFILLIYLKGFILTPLIGFFGSMVPFLPYPIFSNMIPLLLISLFFVFMSFLLGILNTNWYEMKIDLQKLKHT
jgi:hypothetical protein